MNSKPKNRKPTGREAGTSTTHTRAHRERRALEDAAALRQARRPTCAGDPAVQLYRKEKRRAIKRGCNVLVRREPIVRDQPRKRDHSAYNAEYWERNKEILREARAKYRANRRARKADEAVS